MMMSYYLSHLETAAWASAEGRAQVRYDALRLAERQGRRFCELVGSDGKLLAVLEVSLAMR